MGYKARLKQLCQQGNQIGVVFDGKEYIGKVIHLDMQNINDYELTLDCKEQNKTKRMMFPIANNSNRIIPFEILETKKEEEPKDKEVPDESNAQSPADAKGPAPRKGK